MGADYSAFKETTLLSDVADAGTVDALDEDGQVLIAVPDGDDESRLLPDPENLTVGTTMIVVNSNASTGLLVKEAAVTVATLEPSESALCMVSQTTSGVKEWQAVVLGVGALFSDS